MNKINKIFLCAFCALFWLSFLSASEPEFAFERIFKLKKDEKAYISLKKKRKLKKFSSFLGPYMMG